MEDGGAVVTDVSLSVSLKDVPAVLTPLNTTGATTLAETLIEIVVPVGVLTVFTWIEVIGETVITYPLVLAGGVDEAVVMDGFFTVRTLAVVIFETVLTDGVIIYVRRVIASNGFSTLIAIAEMVLGTFFTIGVIFDDVNFVFFEMASTVRARSGTHDLFLRAEILKRRIMAHIISSGDHGTLGV